MTTWADCTHENAEPKMVGRWCPDCGSWKNSEQRSDEDGCVHETGSEWRPPGLALSLQRVRDALERAKAHVDIVCKALGAEDMTACALSAVSIEQHIDAALKESR